MATESPMRLVESSVGRKWPSSEEASKFVPSSGNMEVEELGLLLKGHSFNRTERDLLPGRSGSAPPSMEGSVAAIKNLLGQQSSSGLNESLASLNHAIKNCESEEQLRADAAYLKYYDLNVNLNPRLPPPHISRENRHRVHHIGGFGNNSRWTSFDVNDRSLLLSQGILSTHEEEPEDDRSPGQASDDWLERSSGSLSGQYTASLAGRHKSLVDLIQEDFPRTPSPVYNQSRSLGHATADEDHTPCGSSLLDSSVDATKLPDLNVGSVDLCGGAPMLGMNAVGLTSNADSSVATMPSSSSPDGAGNAHIIHKGESSVTATNREDDTFTSGVNVSHMTSMESEMKALRVSKLPNTENHRNQREWRHNHHSNSLHHHTHSQRNAVYQSQGVQSHLISSGLKRPYGGLDQFSHGAPKLSSVELQTMYPTSGVTPPLYATATAYMGSGNPFYPNLQTSGLFAPQYGVGGYALNTTVVPPFIAGYPSHSMIPMPFDGIPGPNYNSRTPGVSTGGNLTHGIDLQNLNKFYGHVGLTMHPPLADPHYMQYFQNPFPDAYGASRQYDPLASRGNVMGSQVNVINSHKDFTVAAHMGDQIHQNQHFITGGVSIPNTRKGEITTTGYYGSPPSMGVLMQFPSSPLASPVLPASPVGGTSLPGKKNEMRLLPGSSRNAGISSGWQGIERFEDPKTYSFLEELKSSKSRKFELSDIAGRIIEFSSDQHGSRFIQQKLENCTFEEKASVFSEVLPHASKLMTDVFGNYVIQKFFEHGSPEQRRELANQLAGQILPLSLQMYGCRVIQKALEVIELDQKTQLVYELDGHVMRCVRDQNGNHVIQKCIECLPTDRIGFIISSFRGQVATLSTHPYGCRVIQRVLEHCTDSLQSQCLVDEILESACVLAQDQYGNYVTQGKPHERNQVVSKLAGQIVQMSQHKFASNVVEKCLEHGDAASRELLIEEIVGQTEGNDNLLTMMKDQFANYVVQKILETCSDKQREVLLNRIRIHLHALKKYTYGKHIVARFEQLSSEENSLET